MRKIEKLIYRNERGEAVEFSTASKYHTNEASGLNDIKNAIYSFNSMGQDGDTYLGNRIESREIEIVGDINVKTKDDMIALRRWLTHVLNPQLNATLTYEYGDFTRIIDCKVDNAPVFVKRPVFQGFTIQLLCLDPFWREITESRVDIASWQGGFEFEIEIPIDTGIELGFREPALIVNVNNSGDVRSGIRVDFRAVGTVRNPNITNMETLEFIKFINLTMTYGDVLTISTNYGNKKITFTRDGEVTDGFRYLDVDSTYIQLALGDNLFTYDAESGAENLEITVYHSNRYLGV